MRENTAKAFIRGNELSQISIKYFQHTIDKLLKKLLCIDICRCIHVYMYI